MKVCPICGSKYDEWLDSARTKSVCDECVDEHRVVLNDPEMMSLWRALHNLYNRDWNEDEQKQVADSAVFPWLVEEIMPLMEAKCMGNLQKKVWEKCLDQ